MTITVAAKEFAFRKAVERLVDEIGDKVRPYHTPFYPAQVSSHRPGWYDIKIENDFQGFSHDMRDMVLESYFDDMAVEAYGDNDGFYIWSMDTYQRPYSWIRVKAP